MFAQAAFIQNWKGNVQLSIARDRQQNHSAAVHAFNKAKKRGFWRALEARLTRRSVQLQHYAASGRQSAKRASSGVQYIPLDQVIGSEGRGRDFDDQFWPLTDHSRARWVSIAVAMGTNQALPPIQLIKVADGYVVRDGNHRLSVARAFGRDLIEAEIV